jgi:hypothetical protein
LNNKYPDDQRDARARDYNEEDGFFKDVVDSCYKAPPPSILRTLEELASEEETRQGYLQYDEEY